MSINLAKGHSISLKKEDGTKLEEVIIGLGWQIPKVYDGSIMKAIKALFVTYDLDSFVVMLQNDRYEESNDLIYFNNLEHRSKAVIHRGDDLVGGKKGDCEQIIIKLPKIPAKYNRLVIGVNIYCAAQKHQQFGDVTNAYVRVINRKDGSEFCRYDLRENYGNYTAIVVGDLTRTKDGWAFNAIGDGTYDKCISDFTARLR